MRSQKILKPIAARRKPLSFNTMSTRNVRRKRIMAKLFFSSSFFSFFFSVCVCRYEVGASKIHPPPVSSTPRSRFGPPFSISLSLEKKRCRATLLAKQFGPILTFSSKMVTYRTITHVEPHPFSSGILLSTNFVFCLHFQSGCLVTLKLCLLKPSFYRN